MKIYKSNTRETFDTDDISAIRWGWLNSVSFLFLSDEQGGSHLEILSKYFPQDHPIFHDFGNSGYWIIPEKQSVV